MLYKYLLNLIIVFNGFLVTASEFSNIVILSTSNVHGEVDPCG